MSTPNIARLRLWAQELKTTTLEQGKVALERDNRYCCLGIAEVVRARECRVAPVLRSDDGCALAGPSAETDKWYGMRQGGDAIERHDGRSFRPNLFDLPLRFPDIERPVYPWEANDDFGKTFPEIGVAVDEFCDRMEAMQEG